MMIVEAITVVHGVVCALENEEAYQSVADAYPNITWFASEADDNGSLPEAETPPLSLAEVEAAVGQYERPAADVRKLLIVDRLIAADKLTAALSALDADAVAKARWDASVEIPADDADVRAFLTAIGADPDAILAPES